MFSLDLKAFGQKITLKKETILLICILTLSAFLRFYGLGQVPVGLNQDEASMTIEARFLLETSRDRWGNFLPVYFPSWGSGQNVLLSYLTVPFVYFFGVSVWSTRIVSALLGIWAIWLIFDFTKRIANTTTALCSSLLLTILPWHLMASRWGLESNILPVFFLWGMAGLAKNLDQRRSELLPSISKTQQIDENSAQNPTAGLTKWREFTLQASQTFAKIRNFFSQYFFLVPFALALYGYGAGFLVVFIFFFLVLIFYHHHIIQNLPKWLIATGFFGLVFAPLGLFIFKNYLTKVNYDWEKYLPFTVPLLGITRLEQIGSDRQAMLLDNYQFVIGGFKDTLPWNTLSDFGTIPEFLFIFIFVGLGCCLHIFRKKQVKSEPKEDLEDPNNLPKNLDNHKLILLPVLWLIACVGTLGFIPANVNRANIVFIPVIILISIGLVKIGEQLQTFQKIYYAAVLTPVLVYFLLFAHHYFVIYPNNFHFAKDLDIPFSLIKNSQEPVLVTNTLPLSYVYILFYTNYSSVKFQNENQNTNFDVKRVGNFYLDSNLLQTQNITNFEFLLPISQKACPQEVISYQNKFWKVGRCFKKE